MAANFTETLRFIGQRQTWQQRSLTAACLRALFIAMQMLVTCCFWYADVHGLAAPGWPRIDLDLVLACFAMAVPSAAALGVFVAVVKERKGRTLELLRITGVGAPAICLVRFLLPNADGLSLAISLPLPIVLVYAGGGTLTQVAAAYLSIYFATLFAACVALYWSIRIRTPVFALGAILATVAVPAMALAFMTASHDQLLMQDARDFARLTMAGRMVDIFGLPPPPAAPANWISPWNGPLLSLGDLLNLGFAGLLFAAAWRNFERIDDSGHDAPAAGAAQTRARWRDQPIWFAPPRPRPGAAAFAMRQFHLHSGGWEWFLIQSGLVAALVFAGPWHGNRWNAATCQAILALAAGWTMFIICLRLCLLFFEERMDGMMDDLRTLPVPLSAIFHAKCRAAFLATLPLVIVVGLFAGVLAWIGLLPDPADLFDDRTYFDHPALTIVHALLPVPIIWLVCAMAAASSRKLQYSWPRFDLVVWLRVIARFLGGMIVGGIAVILFLAFFTLPWILRFYGFPVPEIPAFLLAGAACAVTFAVVYRDFIRRLDQGDLS